MHARDDRGHRSHLIGAPDITDGGAKVVGIDLFVCHTWLQSGPHCGTDEWCRLPFRRGSHVRDTLARLVAAKEVAVSVLRRLRLRWPRSRTALLCSGLRLLESFAYYLTHPTFRRLCWSSGPQGFSCDIREHGARLALGLVPCLSEPDELGERATIHCRDATESLNFAGSAKPASECGQPPFDRTLCLFRAKMTVNRGIRHQSLFDSTVSSARSSPQHIA